MDTISQKKVLISYVITSVIIFFLSAAISISGIFGNHMGDASANMSIELVAVIQLLIVLTANFILHLFFYYGGFATAPILKGVGIGAVLGVVYFLVSVFALNAYDINAESLQLLVSAMGGRVIEYATGGIATAVISVSDIHRWGVLRAF